MPESDSPPQPPGDAEPGPVRIAPLPGLRLSPLPPSLNDLVGREAETAFLTELLPQPQTHLVTITGPGGVGKTRLALSVATALRPVFPDGVAFISLAALRDPNLLLPTICQALGIRTGGAQSPLDRLGTALRSLALLLVLDNLEQIAAAAPQLTELLLACPSLTLLATSRERLRLAAERVFPLAPLPTATEQGRGERRAVPAAPAVSDAVRLFDERARAVDPTFRLTNENLPVVAEICTRLDGLPLAIELAAARLPILPPHALLTRLHHSLPLLTAGHRDLPERQQTLRGTIAWSYDLLSPGEQTLFRCLAVFRGGFTLAAAEAIESEGRRFGESEGDDEGRAGSQASRRAGRRSLPSDPPTLRPSVLDLIASLVDRSLLLREEGTGGEPRFRMLETIREFGLEQLAACGEEATVRERHAAWCLELAESSNRVLDGPEWDSALTRLTNELDNFRSALAWFDRAPDPEPALRLGAALTHFWQIRGHMVEGRDWLERILRRTPAVTTVPRAAALLCTGMLALYIGDYAVAESYLHESLALWQQLGDPGRIAALFQGLGGVAEYRGDDEAAARHYQQSLDLQRAIGNQDFVANLLENLGDLAFRRGDLVSAAALATESLDISRQVDDPWVTAYALVGLAQVRCALGNIAQAIGLLNEAFAPALAGESPDVLADVLVGIGAVAASIGRHASAAMLLGAADTVMGQGGWAVIPHHAQARRTEAASVAALGEAGFQHSRAAGRALPSEDALALAQAELAAAGRRPGSDAVGPYGLTERERSVLRLLAQGYSNPDIAEALSISPITARNHVNNILAKLGLDSRAAAAAFAVRNNLA